MQLFVSENSVGVVTDIYRPLLTRTHTMAQSNSNLDSKPIDSPHADEPNTTEYSIDSKFDFVLYLRHSY
jgi:hypothetical protein